MKFSICTAVYYDKVSPDNLRQPRYEMFLRCANSVVTQTVKDFEWVVVDDICVPAVSEVVEVKPNKVIRLPEKSGRIVARNTAMRESKGDWICWLDADDEYASIYLEAIDKATKVYPDYKMFNMNHLIFDYGFGTSVRKFIDPETLGGQPFGSGTIGAGAFVFHRSLYDQVGDMPELGLWPLVDWAMEHYPELKPFFWSEDKQAYNSLGNPWGDDFLFFYMLLKKAEYKCKYLDTALYYVHSHYGHRWKDDPDYLLGENPKPQWNPQL